MLARINKAMAKKDSGFTLIELLVVVIIIGILAAIAIPTFLSQRENGWRAQATSNLRNAISNVEATAVNNNGTYNSLAAVAATANDPVNRGIASLDGNLVQVGTAGTTTDYCIQVTHPSYTSNGTFSYDKLADEIVQAPCS